LAGGEGAVQGGSRGVCVSRVVPLRERGEASKTDVHHQVEKRGAFCCQSIVLRVITWEGACQGAVNLETIVQKEMSQKKNFERKKCMGGGGVVVQVYRKFADRSAGERGREVPEGEKRQRGDAAIIS